MNEIIIKNFQKRLAIEPIDGIVRVKQAIRFGINMENGGETGYMTFQFSAKCPSHNDIPPAWITGKSYPYDGILDGSVIVICEVCGYVQTVFVMYPRLTR